MSDGQTSTDWRKACSLLAAGFRDRAPWWGGDMQTLRNQLRGSHAPASGVSTSIEFALTDGSGDRLCGTLEKPDGQAGGAPLIVLIHGLTGCEDSFYIRESARFHRARGRPVLRLNLRGAGRGRSIAKGYYHAGCARDVLDALNGLAQRLTLHGIVPIGYSLGGNILLSLLATPGLPRSLVGAATISAPIEPLEACRRLLAPRNWIYHRFLLQRLKNDVLASVALSPAERQSIGAARSLYDFDDKWVAPRNGFRDAPDY